VNYKPLNQGVEATHDKYKRTQAAVCIAYIPSLVGPQADWQMNFDDLSFL